MVGQNGWQLFRVVVILLVSATGWAHENSSSKKREELDQLRRKIDVLSEELNRIKEQLVIPETDKLKTKYGLGPAASKVYFQKGLSIGGYGEFYFQGNLKNKAGSSNVADAYRVVLYLGYKFTDWLVLNAEIEFEHGTTDNNGEISVEFAYLDFLIHRAVNLRLGLLLVPMGLINETHEPPFFHGNLRPQVETTIIPATWRELGVMLHGEIVPGFSYKLFAVSGMDGSKFSKSGWRSGRQNGSKAIAQDWAFGLALQYHYRNLFLVGGSAYFGGADQDREVFKGADFSQLLAEVHLQVRVKGFEFRALGALGWLDSARTAMLALDAGSNDLIASKMFGYYAEVAYDFFPLFGTGKNMYLAPFVRFEHINTQFKTPNVVGRSKDESLNEMIIDAGITFKPHPKVVIKVNYRERFNKAKKAKVDSLFVGAGFVF